MILKKRLLNILSKTVLACSIVGLLNHCSFDKEKIREKPKQQINVSAKIAKLINDTSSVNPLIDSLRIEFSYSKIEDQLNILGDLAENWRPYTYYLAKEELDQSIKLHYPFGEGDAYCKFGIYYVRKFNFDSAKYYLGRAGSMASLNGKLKGIQAQGLSWNAEILRLSGEVEKSIVLQDQVIAMCDTVTDNKRLAFCNISKGESYRLISEYNKAVECYHKAIKYAIKVNDLNKISICYNSMGDLYRNQSNYPKALEFFNKALDIAKKWCRQAGSR